MYRVYPKRVVSVTVNGRTFRRVKPDILRDDDIDAYRSPDLVFRKMESTSNVKVKDVPKKAKLEDDEEISDDESTIKSTTKSKVKLKKTSKGGKTDKGKKQ